MTWGFILGSVVIALSGLVVLLVGIANHREEVEHQKKLAKLRHRSLRAKVGTGFWYGINAVVRNYRGADRRELWDAIARARNEDERCVNEVCGDEP